MAILYLDTNKNSNKDVLNQMYTPERNLNDLKRWNPMINRIYYEKGKGKYEGMIRTYTMLYNIMANKITPSISNWVHMEPTPEMKPYHPDVMKAVLTTQRNTNQFY